MIKATISDSGLVTILEKQMETAQMSLAFIEPVRDQHLFGHPFAIYVASLCDSNGCVYDAWVVSGGYNGSDFPYGGIYNKENYPKDQDALAAHVGRLVIDAHLKLVEPADDTGSKRKRSRKSNL